MKKQYVVEIFQEEHYNRIIYHFANESDLDAFMAAIMNGIPTYKTTVTATVIFEQEIPRVEATLSALPEEEE